MASSLLHSKSIIRPPAALVLGALISVQILFGLNYVISKVVVEAFPPLVWASIRIIISANILLFIAIVLKRPHPTGGASFFGPLVIFALLGTIINQSCFLVGLHYTTSTNAAVLNTLIPVFTLLIVTLRGQEAATLKRVVGFISALTGVLVLRRIEEFKLSDQTAIGDLLNILNCLSYALFLSYGKKFIERNDRIWTTAWLFVYGSVGLSIIAIPDYLTFQLPELTPTLLACAAFAIIGGTLLTYFLNNWALAHSKSSNVALWIYIQPVFAAALAWVWFDQPITTRMIFSTLLIFIGMYLGLSKTPTATQTK